jgi:hypothetical protein
MADDKPDPNEFKQMYKQEQNLRVDDFVGSYSNTGRVKLEKKKQWGPKKAEQESANKSVDEWMGSGKVQPRSWKVKSAADKPKVYNSDSDEENKGETVRRHSESTNSTRRWKPSPGNTDVLPPGMQSPEKPRRASTMPKWTPKTPQPSISSPSTMFNDGITFASLADDKEKNTDDRMWNSHGAIGYTHNPKDNYDGERPDPSAYRVQAGNDGGIRVDDFVDSFNNTGRVKSQRKSWTPTPTVENARPDDWLGSPGSSRRSWKAKSHSQKPNKKSEDEEQKVQVKAPTPPVPSAPDLDTSHPAEEEDDEDSSAVEVDSDAEEEEAEEARRQRVGNEIASNIHKGNAAKPASPKSSPKKAWKSSSAIDNNASKAHDDDGRPDPNEFVEMLKVSEADVSRHDDYVGSYSKTGRAKHEKKRWTTKKPDEGSANARVDEWMGSGKVQKKSWKVKKSTSNQPLVHDSDGEDESTPLQPLAPTRALVPIPKPEPEITEAPAPAEEPAQTSENNEEHEVDSEEGEYEVDSDEDQAAPTQVSDDEAKPAPAPVPAAKPVDPDVPDPNEFKQMYKQEQNLRVDDFVGSYSNTGRVKLEKKKQWGPKKVDEESANKSVDEWMGSGQKPTKSWKVKK